MSATTIKATGLTCNHCAMSVREEIEEIENVTGVEVDVVKGVQEAGQHAHAAIEVGVGHAAGGGAQQGRA